jgi:ureidoacrylate peracid hydrolase
MSGAAELLLSVEEQVRPAHAALVIVDLQNDFCAEDGFLSRARAEGGGPKIREEDNVRVAQNIDRLATAARAARMPVVWLRSIYDFKYLAPAHIAKRGGKEGLCMEGSWGADFFRIRPQPGDLVVDKHTFSGFHQTRLHEALQAQGVKTLVFTGVATNVCVDSTLREGFFLGYYVVLAEDCVSSSNGAGHEGTLATVRVNFGTVLRSEELIALLGRDAEAGRPAA